MRYNEAQFQLAMARAAAWAAIIQSGAYKLQRTQVGCGHNADGTLQFRPQTDEEKLRDATATLWRHLEMAAEFAETFPIK